MKKECLSDEDTMQTLIKQPYAITMANQTFNKHEQRIMLRVLEALQVTMNEYRHIDKQGNHLRYYTPSEVRKTNLGDTIIRIAPKYLLPAGSKNHEEVKKAVKSLTKKGIEIKNKNKDGKIISEVYTNVITVGKYENQTEFVELTIYKDFVPQLLALARDFLGKNNDKTADNYTSYFLEPSFKFSSKYTMRMYQYASHHRDFAGKKPVVVRLKSLREWLGIEEKYKEPYTIKQQILTPVIRELKDKADVWFEIIGRVMENRKMIAWKFSIYTKKQEKKFLAAKPINLQQKLLTEEPADLEKKLEEEKKEMMAKQKKIRDMEIYLEEKAFEHKLAEEHELTKKQVSELLRFALVDRRRYMQVFQVLDYVQKKKPNNIGGYTVKVLKEKLGLEL